MQELAWSTYALLKNTNTAGVLVCADGAVLAARGALRQCPSDTILQTLEQARLHPATLILGFRVLFWPRV